MPKTVHEQELPNYAPVAERIDLFYAKHPNGRIKTTLISKKNGEITFRAAVFRDLQDRVPSSTGWASELIGDGDVNAVACLENTETSAIGRALANLGFTASRYRPSAEEMEKAVRARERIVDYRDKWPRHPQLQSFSPVKKASQKDPEAVRKFNADLAADLIELIDRAEREGVSADIIAKARTQATIPGLGIEEIERIERTIRDAIKDRDSN